MKKNKTLESIFIHAEARGLAATARTPSEGKMLRLRLKSEEVISPLKGVYVRPEWWKSLSYTARGECLIRTAAYLSPNTIFAGTYAAWIYGFDTSLFHLRTVQKMIKRHSNSRNKRENKAFYSNASDLEECQIVRGLKVCSPYKALFDSARTLEFVDALPLCDRALRSGSIRQEALVQFVLDRKRWRGWQNALRVAQCASPKAESGGESAARALMIELGFEVPHLQAVFTDKDGRKRRADFLWKRADGRIVIGEFDGRQKYLDPSMTHGRTPQEILREEKEREDELSLYGVWLLRFGPDLLKNPALFAAKLNRAGVPHAAVSS